MSDLQCPARFFVVGAVGEKLLRDLAGEHVALVYDAVGSADQDADGSRAAGEGSVEAREAAEALSVAVRRLTRRVDVEDVLAGRPDALDVLRELSDLHRGETVLVLARARGAGGVARVSVDGDGAVVASGTS